MIDNDLLKEIISLGNIHKELSPEAVAHIRSEVNKCFSERPDISTEEVTLLLINYVYNEAYLSAINDVISLIFKKK